MDSKIKVTIILFLGLLVFTSCRNQLTNDISLNIPSGFEVISHDENSDEILALNYNNEMQIIISTNSSKIIKKGQLFGYGVLEIALKAKFPNLVQKFSGKNVGEFKKISVDQNIYLYQTFDFTVKETSGYYEHGGLYIQQPEEYFEFFISGDKSKQNKHRKVIDNLIKEIK